MLLSSASRDTGLDYPQPILGKHFDILTKFMGGLNEVEIEKILFLSIFHLHRAPIPEEAKFLVEKTNFHSALLQGVAKIM